MSLDIRIYGRAPVWDANLTHNLCNMAREADLYKVMWRPDEYGINKASEALPFLRAGLDKLLLDPAKYEAMNPENGWGSYDTLVATVRRYIKACEENPNGEIEVSR